MLVEGARGERVADGDHAARVPVPPGKSDLDGLDSASLETATAGPASVQASIKGREPGRCPDAGVPMPRGDWPGPIRTRRLLTKVNQ